MMLKLNMHRGTVGYVNWNAHASGRYGNVGRVHDFPGFLHHFPFLVGIAIVEETIDVWDDVEAYLLV